MRNVVFMTLVVIASVVIVVSFFTPWARVSVSAIGVSQELTNVADEKLGDVSFAKKFIGKLIILDGGHNKDKIGLLQDVRNNKIALITAESNTMYWNLTHIKTVQFP